MKKKELIEVCLRCIQAYSTEKEWTVCFKICQERLEKLNVERLQDYIDCYNPRGMIMADDATFYVENSPLGDYSKEVLARYRDSTTILIGIKDAYKTNKNNLI